MDIVVANGFVMESCTFFSREYHCCVLHNTRCKCEDYNPRNSSPITNADRIRAMTDEELAGWIAKFYGCSHCPGFNVPCDNRCAEYWFDWLKQEAKDDEV